MGLQLASASGDYTVRVPNVKGSKRASATESFNTVVHSAESGVIPVLEVARFEARLLRDLKKYGGSDFVRVVEGKAVVGPSFPLHDLVRTNGAVVRTQAAMSNVAFTES